MHQAYAVIMAGGSGTRFFPMSTPECPKQFLKLFGSRTMIRETRERVRPLFDDSRVFIATNQSYEKLVLESLHGIQADHLLFEPASRNTGPALGLACLRLLREDPEAIVVSLHSDHHIEDEERFRAILSRSIELAQEGYIALLGIEPDYPETGYGYIQRGDALVDFQADPTCYKVKAFQEKPQRKTAEEYLERGGYFWNAGMFISKAKLILDEMKVYEPELYKGLMKIDELENFSGEEFGKLFQSLPKVPIDIAVMERSEKVAVIPCDFGWSDVGSFYSLFQLRSQSSQENVCLGDSEVRVLEASGNLVGGEGPIEHFYLLDVNDMMIVQNGNRLLVGSLKKSQEVKKFLEM